MAMSSEDWMMVNAKIREMEQAVNALKRLRHNLHIAFPNSVLRDLDDAISESEKRLTLLTNTMVN